MCCARKSTYGLVAATLTVPTLGVQVPLVQRMSGGLTLILYSPVTGSDFCARLKLALLELADARVVPSGLIRVMATGWKVLLVILTVTNCPAVPLKKTLPFCPGTLIGTANGASLMFTVVVMSAGMS